MKLILYASLSIILCGCSKPVKLNCVDAIGEYYAEYYGGIDQLVIMENGSYRHEMYSINGEVSINEQRWSCNDAHRWGVQPVIQFSEFFFRKELGIGGEPGFFITELKKVEGSEKKLCFDLDMDRCFINRVQKKSQVEPPPF